MISDATNLVSARDQHFNDKDIPLFAGGIVHSRTVGTPLHSPIAPALEGYEDNIAPRSSRTHLLHLLVNRAYTLVLGEQSSLRSSHAPHLGRLT